MPKSKIFKDPLYGYINIPEDYCRHFIDTSLFQRLRRIEQTSMRALYPTAHHDRFAHSLGVYYLGQLAIESLIENCSAELNKIEKIDWETYRKTFEIACLMHDCGHAPFSHTFEHHYLHGKESKFKEKICGYFTDRTNAEADYDEASPAPHEIVSALLLLEHFSAKISELGAKPELAARMILGCKHEINLNFIKKFENKLISLLNGSGIDVDSLDYIQRDSWISGVSNVGIDYHRLLSALSLKLDKHNNPQIVFNKKVLSVIDNICIGRNFLYKWIYSHHKVQYEQYLLQATVKKINSTTDDDNFCNTIFSYDSFNKPQICNKFSFFLPTDDDLFYAIKQYRAEISEVEELISRNYKFKALWKTEFEFRTVYFRDVSDVNKMKIIAKIQKGKLQEKYNNGLICIKVSPKLKSINSNVFFINVDNQLVDVSEATASLEEKNQTYFLLYASENIFSRKHEIIHDVIQLAS
jgi:hypothetical protein